MAARTLQVTLRSLFSSVIGVRASPRRVWRGVWVVGGEQLGHGLHQAPRLSTAGDDCCILSARRHKKIPSARINTNGMSVRYLLQ
jgi:hypothetical protein